MVAVDRLLAAADARQAAAAQRLGMRRTDVQALEHIAARDDVTPGELGRALGMSSGGVTAVADRLTSAGLVVRRRGRDGRRRVLLRVTAAGRTSASLARGAFEVALDDAAGALDTAGRRQLEMGLVRLAAAVERVASELPAEVSNEELGLPTLVRWG